MEENASPPPVQTSPPAAPSVPPPPPPPPLPPPVIMPPASTPPARRGRGWMIFALILLVLLAFSVLGNFSSLVGSLFYSKSKHMRASGPRLEEVITEDNDASDKIAIVEVDGIITSRTVDPGGHNMVDLIKAQLKRAEEDPKVRAVILKVDSPGGEVLASDDIYHAIADFHKTARKPVVAAMGNLTHSCGH